MTKILHSTLKTIGFLGKTPESAVWLRTAALVFVLIAAGCSNLEQAAPESDEIRDPINADYNKRNTIFGKGGGVSLFGEDGAAQGGGSGLGVNSFLWRASLDTISFMPVSSADPFGGVIITDWQASEKSPNERFKLNVYILGRTLRADGVRVSVFRQQKNADGTWRDAAVPEGTAQKIEDSILTKARQMRYATLRKKQ